MCRSQFSCLNKDDYSMFVVESPDKVPRQMEPQDVLNDEYLCWDANDRTVRIPICGQQGERNLLRGPQIPLEQGFQALFRCARPTLDVSASEAASRMGLDERPIRGLSRENLFVRMGIHLCGKEFPHSNRMWASSPAIQKSTRERYQSGGTTTFTTQQKKT